MIEEGCGLLWTVDDGEPEVAEIPDLTVLETTKNQKSFSIEADPGIEIQAIICWRISVIPAENDYKVIQAGQPLYLQLSDDGERRTTVLEKTGGAYRLRLIDGKMFSDEERELVIAMIERFNLTS